MGGLMLGEVLLVGVPFGIGIALFFLAGRYLSGFKLFILLAMLPILLFPIVSLILPSPYGSAEVALQFIGIICVFAGALVGAIAGAFVRNRVRKNRSGKQQE